MGNSQSISLLSYGILEEIDTKTFLDADHSFANNDSFAKAYLNEANHPCRALELTVKGDALETKGRNTCRTIFDDTAFKFEDY